MRDARSEARSRRAPRSPSALPLSLMAALLALATGCGGGAVASSSPGDATVRRADFRLRVLLTGELAAVREQSLVVPREAAWRHPIRWMEEHGARVVRGQRVLEFDNQALVSRLQEADLRLTQALNELAAKDAEASGQLAQKTLEVERKRADQRKAAIEARVPKELLAERDWQEKRLAHERASLELAKAEDELSAHEAGALAELANHRLAHEKARRDVEAAERALELLELEAPADGILLVGRHPWEDRRIQVGDTVFAGWPVLAVPDLDEMKVVAGLSDVDDGRVLPGMRATCTLDSHPERRFGARVTEVAPVALEEGRGSLRRAFRVTLLLDETDPTIMLPGMSVRVEIEAHAEGGALLAPRTALRLDAEPPEAVLADGGRRPVALGPCNALDCVVTTGLAEGERLGRAREPAS